MGNAFESCTESSKTSNDGWGCKEGFSTNLIDDVASIWGTKSQGTGAWIQLKLKDYYQINKIAYKNRDSISQRNSLLEVSFGGGIEPQQFNLKNFNSVENFNLKVPVITNNVKIMIKSVYTNGNNGGAFDIYGVPCINPNLAQETDNSKEKVYFFLYLNNLILQ